MGYDDIPLAAFASPPLSTMRSNPVGHGKDAMQMLLAQMNGATYQQADLQVERVAQLVIRESCGAYLRSVK